MNPNMGGPDKAANLSPLNKASDVLGRYRMPERIVLHDVTLRDGEQSPGVNFNLEDKIEIAKALDSLGVHRIEAGFPVVSDVDREAVAAIAKLGLRADVWGFGRCVPADVETNAECGLKSMVLEIAVSDIKLAAYGIDRSTVVGRMTAAMHRARTLGMKFAFMPVDMTRADLGFAEEVLKTAVEEGGASEIVVVDTIGVTSPEAMAYLTSLVKEWVEVPLAVHCHNDFGLALANSIASVKAGASCVHVSVNCLGERSGNVDLAEVAMSLQFLYGVDLGIRTEGLSNIARLVERLSGYKLAKNKPVVGEDIFTRETGGVVQQLMASPPSVEPYDPRIVGLERSVVLGKKSGRYSVKYLLERHGIDLADQDIDAVLQVIKQRAGKSSPLVGSDELLSIVETIRK